jgi:hypothetical protein
MGHRYTGRRCPIAGQVQKLVSVNSELNMNLVAEVSPSEQNVNVSLCGIQLHSCQFSHLGQQLC